MSDAESTRPDPIGNEGRQVDAFGTPAPAEWAESMLRESIPAEAIPAESIPAESPTASAFSLSMATLRACVEKILTEHGPQLNRSQRIRLEQWARGALIPKKKAGRRPLLRITRAYEDWKAGVRRIPLYRMHIRGWDKLGYYRRRHETRKLMAAIRSRVRRDAKKSKRGE